MPASLTACSSARPSFRRYKHLDYGQLAELLKSNAGKYRQIFIITESVFSMDGDTADLKQLVALKKQYGGAVLLVDEAHSVGVCGDNGAGLCAELGLLHDVDFIIGTFGKAFGSAGAYVICDALAKDFLIQQDAFVYFYHRLAAGGDQLEQLCIGEASCHDCPKAAFAANRRFVAEHASLDARRLADCPLYHRR